MPLRSTLFALALAWLLSGCSLGVQPAGPPAGPPGPAGPGGAFRVGLLTNGPLTDSGWNALAGQALERIRESLGAEIAHQSQGPAQAEETLRGFARDGFRLVFAHGAEFGDPARRVAEEYRDTVFVVSSGEVQGPNLASLRFDLGEAAYLAGMAAAALSRTGRAGQIGGESYPPVRQAFELFEKGARAVNPKFTTTISYLHSWHDAAAGKETALAMIRSGADILFQNADAAGEGVFQAAKEHPGVLCIGSNANQNDLHPDIIAASAVLDIPAAFMKVARDVREGRFRGGVYRENLAGGHVYLALNPRFRDRIPEAVRRKIEQAERDIRSGRLRLVSE